MINCIYNSLTQQLYISGRGSCRIRRAIRTEIAKGGWQAWRYEFDIYYIQFNSIWKQKMSHSTENRNKYNKTYCFEHISMWLHSAFNLIITKNVYNKTLMKKIFFWQCSVATKYYLCRLILNKIYWCSFFPTNKNVYLIPTFLIVWAKVISTGFWFFWCWVLPSFFA